MARLKQAIKDEIKEVEKMKNRFSIFLTLIILSCSSVQKNQSVVTSSSIVPDEVFQNIYQLKFRDFSGTCFAISIDNKEYLITARHLFPDIKYDTRFSSFFGIEIFKNGKWVLANAKVMVHQNPEIDIAVLRLTTDSIKTNNHFNVGGKYQLSQQGYFLGFPYGAAMPDVNNMHNGYPIPFVKGGIISGKETNPNLIFFLDAFGNPGFSGGPVIVLDDGSDPKRLNPRVIGVVVATQNEPNTTTNAGFVKCYSIDYASEIIIQNPKFK